MVFTKRGKISYGFKIHEVTHVIDWIKAFKITPTASDEQRMEHKHISTNSAFDNYFFAISKFES